MSTTTVHLPQPRVWVGCLACYNEGHLTGQWVNAEDATAVTTEQLHNTHTRIGHEELWCFDLEGLPACIGEISVSEAASWGSMFEAVGEKEWPAFVAWVESGCCILDSDDLPIVSDFEERFCGCWDSFRDFADFEVEETGLLFGVSDEIARYFDYDAYARDLRFDYIVADAPEGGVYLFRSC